MWGDPERASQLQVSDSLVALLLQITSPAHIPVSDPRWQELLHGYDVWVHASGDSAILQRASHTMAKHAATSSNLAALCRHASRMVQELFQEPTLQDTVSALSHRIGVVGKARATAGALSLLKILIHALIVHAPTSLEEACVYRSREGNTDNNGNHANAGMEVVEAILQALPKTNMDDIPEVYDTKVMCLQLLLVFLSTQLYQPLHSHNFMLQAIFAQDGCNHQRLLEQLLDWQIRRPKPPDRSIFHHYQQLVQSVISATKGERVGPDGMYESPSVVMAKAPTDGHESDRALAATTTATTTTTLASHHHDHHSLIYDATRGVLVLSSTIIWLPIRFVQLALGLWGHSRSRNHYDNSKKNQLLLSLNNGRSSSRTKDVLWLTDSPLADLANCLFLVLINNERKGHNPFRSILNQLSDNRWEEHAGLPDLPNFANQTAENGDEEDGSKNDDTASQKTTLMVNFESLFESFGATLHTEVGSLVFYSLLYASPAFAESIPVRSDLDTLILPLLRTLYFSSASRQYTSATQGQQALRRKSSGSAGSSAVGPALDIRSCPFRSSSQLYVIMILLLLFSQDASFGPDAFRRVVVSSVPWYRERYLKDISLGSIMLLVLLRSLLFNLNRLHDAFLLSNACAVLMNLSPSMVDLHEYAALRLASVTVTCLKRYVTDPESMELHGEVCRTLLRLLKHCLSAKHIERNLHLVYAVVYHQADFHKLFQKGCPFSKSETRRIQTVIQTAAKIVQEEGDARTAAKALKVLEDHMDELKQAVTERRKRPENEDFAFTYEEEADPEIFFVPYVWEVIVCVVTSGTLEWNTDHIKVFPLLDVEPTDDSLTEEESEKTPLTYANDVSDVV